MNFEIKNLRDLQTVINNLNPADLDREFLIRMEDDPLMNITSMEITEEDVYYNPDDPDEVGTLEDFRGEYTGDDFEGEVIPQLKISTPKGTIYFE